MLSGVDVSSYQPTYSTKGLDFVFIKVTQGLGYTNPKWKSQLSAARKAKLQVGFYHYPTIANSASSEADHFLATIGSSLAAGDILALDWEWYDQKGVTNAQARAYKAAFLARLRSRQPSHRTILYCNRDAWINVDTDSDCGDGLWIADPTTAGHPRVQHPWTFHQYSTAGGIDHDVANFPSAAALRAWAAGTTPTPENTVALTSADAKTVLTTDGVIAAPTPPVQADDYATNKTWTLASTAASANQAAREANANTKALLTEVAALKNELDAVKTQLAAFADPAGFATQVVAQVKSGLASIKLDVEVGQ
jgi:hypothetical protein